ncbi:MAG TPA: hypothetical protein VKU19_20805 [Bryobacteraceae bacterium]|nr:hypothetical protein [Bryobacteraceae bacterium]
MDHLRWHLMAIYRLAMSEGAADRNPATSLYTPKCKAARERRDLRPEDINLMFEVLDLRERLIVKLAIFEGMRPGEILALKLYDIGQDSFTVEARVYRGEMDTPKTKKSVREGALSDATIEDIEAWRTLQRDPSPNRLFSFREPRNAHESGQSLAAEHSPAAREDWARLGRLSGDAACECKPGAKGRYR